MKWIKYQIVCGKNENEEDVLLNKKIGYSNENLAIAEEEAYDGYEIFEDDEEHSNVVAIPSDIDMKGNRITNLGDAISDDDAVRLGAVRSMLDESLGDIETILMSI